MSTLSLFTAADASIVVGLLTLIGTIVASVYSRRGSKQATEANKAVNGIAPGETRLYDLVFEGRLKQEELLAWKRSWDESPWRDGEAIREWFDQSEEDHKKRDRKLDSIEARIHQIEGNCPACSSAQKIDLLVGDVRYLKKKLG